MLLENNKIGSVRQYRAQNADVTCRQTSITKITHLEYQELEDISSTGHKRPWKEKKIKSKLIADGYNRLASIYPDEMEYFAKKAERINHCGDWYEFKRFEDNTLKLHRAQFCKVRLCPICMWRRSLKVFSQVSQIMNSIQSENDYEYLFLTLTVKNVDGPILTETIGDMITGYLKLIRKTIVKKSVLGCFRSIEITYNKKTCQYHPHIHAVLCVKKSYFKKEYIKNNIWSELWKDCMDLDYMPVIDVRKINGNKSKAVAEAAKYATKDEDILTMDENNQKIADEEIILTLDDALKGRRLISYSGIFKDYQRKLKLEDPDDGDLVHIDDDSIRSDLNYVIERYNWRCGAYVLDTSANSETA